MVRKLETKDGGEDASFYNAPVNGGWVNCGTTTVEGDVFCAFIFWCCYVDVQFIFFGIEQRKRKQVVNVEEGRMHKLCNMFGFLKSYNGARWHLVHDEGKDIDNGMKLLLAMLHSFCLFIFQS